MGSHLESSAPVTLFYSSRGCSPPCCAEDWQRHGDGAGLKCLFYLLIFKAAVLAIGKCQWLFVQELLSSFHSIPGLPALGRAFLSRSSPEDQGLLCSDEGQGFSSAGLQGCSAGGGALRAS